MDEMRRIWNLNDFLPGSVFNSALESRNSVFKQKTPSLKPRALISTIKQAKSGKGNRVYRDVRINVLFHQESRNVQSQVVLPGTRMFQQARAHSISSTAWVPGTWCKSGWWHSEARSATQRQRDQIVFVNTIYLQGLYMIMISCDKKLKWSNFDH